MSSAESMASFARHWPARALRGSEGNLIASFFRHPPVWLSPKINESMQSTFSISLVMLIFQRYCREIAAVVRTKMPAVRLLVVLEQCRSPARSCGEKLRPDSKHRAAVIQCRDETLRGAQIRNVYGWLLQLAKLAKEATARAFARKGLGVISERTYVVRVTNLRPYLPHGTNVAGTYL
ncbi:hypothetical protein SAMN05444169_3708 [Bradyrhizobium erythrophlei]|uniref:Uncharacterized protein n=1 Tax=Bradyrhizobium erythrophlei TaxID=1437360 RepID=A0A1M5LYA8_9BRAD|nr:hypothetical protein SAMN05444169_3708 [Bradyrhizobium erythrophlei]